MKLPLSWLKDYVDIDCSVDELVKKLFSCGFEVEDVIKFGEKIDKIVTCKIKSIEQHPNADKLSVTKVDAGKYGVLQIITSAKNICVGDIVPVALDGSTLANGEHIKTGDLRGVTSYGMFCSGEELGINDDWYEGASVNGILILKEDYPLGEEVKKLLDIEDTILDINITANRPDCQSIYGLAREVAVVLDKPIKQPCLTYKTDALVSTLKTVKVENKAFDLCPRYKAHLVKDVKLEASPLWLRRRLFSMGLRSINNIVDITNFVLLEIGQPMHAFDLSKIDGKEINIRRAEPAEKIITLDEKVFELDNSNLVIADSVKPVALAGVMGGLNSEITDETKDVLFESAKFARDNVRRTSRKLGQRSDSSARYEKGVDYLSVEMGLKRALHLIDELNAGKIACDEYDLIDKPLENKIIKTSVSKINGVLGIDIDKSFIENTLSKLEFEVKIDNDLLEAKVPLFREDIDDYPDLAEEIIREYGYDHLKSTLLKTAAITGGGKNFAQKKVDEVKELLVSYGFNEGITYSFVPENDFDLFEFAPSATERSVIKLINPLSEDTAVMRTTLMPSLVKAAVYNLNRKNNEGKIFELAKIYIPSSSGENGVSVEKNRLCFVMFGETDFYDCKGVAEGIFSTFCYDKKVEFVKSNKPYLHPTRSADMYLDGKFVGYLGQVKPTISDKLGTSKEIFVVEIDYEQLEKTFTDKIVFKQISKFPTIERDLAVMVDENVEWHSIEKIVIENAGEFLTKIKLFDIYQGDQIQFGKKSVAFNMTFVSNERTLEVEEIETVIGKILSALKESLGAELR